MNAEMLTLPLQAETHDDFLDDSLGALIQRRLGTRVRELRVRRLPKGLVIQGRAPTYYVKQLATHAAMDLADVPILANDIEVT